MLKLLLSFTTSEEVRPTATALLHLACGAFSDAGGLAVPGEVIQFHFPINNTVTLLLWHCRYRLIGDDRRNCFKASKTNTRKTVVIEMFK